MWNLGSTEWDAVVSAFLIGGEVVLVSAATLVREDEAAAAGGAVVPATRWQRPARIANRHLLQTRWRCAPTLC